MGTYFAARNSDITAAVDHLDAAARVAMHTLGSKDRIAALHFDLARSWVHLDRQARCRVWELDS